MIAKIVHKRNTYLKRQLKNENYLYKKQVQKDGKIVGLRKEMCEESRMIMKCFIYAINSSPIF